MRPEKKIQVFDHRPNLMDSNEFHKEFDYGTIEEIVKLIKVNKSDFQVANSAIRKLTKKKKLSYSKIMQFVRILLSGRNEGPPVKDMIELLGVDEAIVRLDIGLEFYLWNVKVWKQKD